MKDLVIVVFFLGVFVVSTHGLKCLPCTTDRCLDSPSAQDCPYGLVLDVCQCCQVCGKGPGESCGGFFNLFGRCGEGLTCIIPPETPENISRKGACQ